ncbi:MAG: energy transducer TonB [Candidatus Gastranaerophilales bacterium]|nr:energy transducer TonB [Candidatus Gastranaerophilales bacterium]
MKKIILATLLFTVSFVLANELSDFEFIKNSAYSYKKGILYSIKNNKTNSRITLFAESDNDTAIIMSAGPFSKVYKPIYMLKKNQTARKFSDNSQILAIQKELFKNINSLDKCPEAVCVAKDLGQFANIHTNQYKSLTIDEAINAISGYKNSVSDFMSLVEKGIKSNWTPAKSPNSYSVTVNFTVNHEGNIDEVSIFKSSGDAQADENALQAVKKSGKFDVPDDLKYVFEKIPIEFTFDYNILNSSYITHENLDIYYLKGIEKKLNKNWNGQYLKNNYTKVQLQIDKNGNVININYLTKNINELDQKAISGLIDSSAPFRALPLNYKKDKAYIELTFSNDKVSVR